MKIRISFSFILLDVAGKLHCKSIHWNPEDIIWIKLMDKLMSMMLGDDFFPRVFS